MADGVEQTPSPDDGDQLLDVQREQDGADQSEQVIVDEEQALELERLAIAHPFAPAEDDRVVNHHEDGRARQRRHGRLPDREPEFIGRVARYGLEGATEEGPEVNTERTVDGREGKGVPW